MERGGRSGRISSPVCRAVKKQRIIIDNIKVN